VFLTKILKYAKIGKGELYIALAGMVVLLWLHGDLLFFWDTIFPFHPLTDIYFYSFTWNQAIFYGIPSKSTTNEWLSYFVFIYVLHDILGLTMPLSQLVLFYSLFTLSGITMYRLIKFLSNENYNATFSLPALSGALVYMFNFYMDYFILFDFFESWFIYSLLPLIIILFLSGIRKSVRNESYWKDIIYLVLLFEVVSVSFWEVPYLLWTIFIIFIFIIGYFLQNNDKKNGMNYVSIAKFLLISSFAIIITGLWYIYTYFQTLAGNLRSVSPSVSPVGSAVYHILINSLTSVGQGPIVKALRVIAIYPTYSPPPGDLLVWQNLYLFTLSPLNIIFIATAIIFLFAVFFPLFQRGLSKNKIINNKLLYASIFILIFFGLQGINPLLRGIVNLLLILKFPYISLLYGTNMQFLGFPLIFLYAVAVSKTVLLLSEPSKEETKSKPLKKNYKIKYSKIYTRAKVKKRTGMITFVLLIMIVAVYPWYMWTPYATPVYVTGYDGQVIPSVVNIPGYVYEMTDYIHATAGNSNTLILPTSNNFLTMGFKNSSFADDQYPALMFGSPVLFQQKMAHNNVTADIENLTYNPLLFGHNLSNYLSELNIKFIVLNKDFIVGAENAYYENITYLQNMLQNQPHIKLVEKFGPLLVYENFGDTGIIQIGSASHFNATPSNPYGEKSILKNFEAKGFAHYQLNPVTYNITDNGSIILENNRLISNENPVWFVNNNPLDVNISKYHYLSITFKTSSPNVSLYVSTTTGFSNCSFGNSILQPLNLSSYTLSPLLFVNSTNYRTFIYPLFDQPPMWYSHFNNTHNYTLNSIVLSLNFNHLITNESGSIEITNISLSKFISIRDNFYYMASYINNTNQVLVPNNIYTNGMSLNRTSVTFREINPTRYVVNIANADSPFILNLKQTFNSNWDIYINNRQVSCPHFHADIYNNGWLITKKGNYTIQIIYSPQKEYNIVTTVSFYPLILIIGLIIPYQSYIYYTKKFRRR